MSDAKQFPDTLVWAVLVTEDKRFFEHRGVDWRAFARACWVCLKRRRFVQGGSTITMQLVRGSRFAPKGRTVRRKLWEIAHALKVERHCTKEQILGTYLHNVYLGKANGFPKAARKYFGKDIDQCTLNEQVALVAMLASPGRFSPKSEEGLLRQRMVLRKLWEAGLIEDAQWRDAVRETLPAGLQRIAFEVECDMFMGIKSDLFVESCSPERLDRLAGLSEQVAPVTAEDVAELQSALQVGGSPEHAGKVLQVEALPEEWFGRAPKVVKRLSDDKFFEVHAVSGDEDGLGNVVTVFDEEFYVSLQPGQYEVVE